MFTKYWPNLHMLVSLSAGILKSTVTCVSSEYLSFLSTTKIILDLFDMSFTKPEYVQNFPYLDSVSHTTVTSITAYSSAILLVASIKRTCKILWIWKIWYALLPDYMYSYCQMLSIQYWALSGFKFAWLIEIQHLSINLVKLILLEKFPIRIINSCTFELWSYEN